MPDGTIQKSPRMPGPVHEFKEMSGGTIAGIGTMYSTDRFSFYANIKRTFNMPQNKTSVRVGVVHYPNFLKVKKPSR